MWTPFLARDTKWIDHIIDRIKEIYDKYISRKKKCPCCNEWTLKKEKVTVAFEEEPPMFIRWVCYNCNRATPPLATSIVRDVASEEEIQALTDHLIEEQNEK